jgi:N-acetylglucosaminyldiphosphoundecaprenol N-acetyl-beta-D-mannosaminyltransferase
MTINILGINISTDSKQEVLKKISDFLLPSSQSRYYIVTPNPEFLLAARKDEEFFYILNQADVAVPDGIGLTFAGLFMGKIIRRISGVDLMLDICEFAEKENKSIFLLGGENGAAEQAAEKLKLKFPRLKIAGAEEGLKPGSWKLRSGKWLKGKIESKKLEAKINEARPDILFVAFGHPKQEKWAYHSLPNLNSVRLAMGVGGSFDFIAGKIKRAPKLMRSCGLEWLWRLMQEPQKRLPRIYDAVIIFPWEFFKWRFIRPWQFRPNVACLLYRKVSDRIEVLLAERNHPAGHWQLPQGGTDGEDLATAGARELREEIGTRKFKPIASFKNLHKYKFGDAISRGVKSSQILGYKGQKQGLFIAEFFGKDDDITINFWDHRSWKWVDLEKVESEVHQYRQEATKIFIEKFKSIL